MLRIRLGLWGGLSSGTGGLLRPRCDHQAPLRGALSRVVVPEQQDLAAAQHSAVVSAAVLGLVLPHAGQADQNVIHQVVSFGYELARVRAGAPPARCCTLWQMSQ